jgi:hypothetical protein
MENGRRHWKTLEDTGRFWKNTMESDGKLWKLVEVSMEEWKLPADSWKDCISNHCYTNVG